MSEPSFTLKSPFSPKGDQPKAIRGIIEGFESGCTKQVLLGVTGSGKTFTMAHVIAKLGKPTLVIAHNKTLAAQLYQELKEFFPDNAVEYFVSYYDYYQPESYIPQTDTYIEKDAQINAKIEQMRLSATMSLLTRKDAIIVASVSCIYGLGDPSNFGKMAFRAIRGLQIGRNAFLSKLLDMQYERNDTELVPGRFRVKGDTVDIALSYFDDRVLRVEFFGDEIDRISYLSRREMKRIEDAEEALIFPARHFVVPEEEMEQAISSIEMELKEHLPKLGPMEAHRLEQRTKYDIEMMHEVGYCKGIENYSRHFDGRRPGEPPYTLLDYFPDDFLMIIDESHQTIPQLHAMHKGDYSRKENLVKYGFRLPSAFDNRPLTFSEFKKYMRNVLFVSATPGNYELNESCKVVEQIIRPTGLVDPEISVRPTEGQMEDLLKEIIKTISEGDRALVTTLTKRLAEELTEYLGGKGIKAGYLHSEIDTLDRTEIIRQLRLGKFDVLVGINLLREGLDIPEVGFIAILDADKEGFLRNDKSLIQTMGRAARNTDSRVILYADTITDSMRRAIDETERRRKIQIDYNKKHGITPQKIIKPVREGEEREIKDIKHIPKSEIPNLIIELDAIMRKAADELNFEEAIRLRDRIRELEKRII
ncbi:MAG: excinuclease ABC subunit UvrB [Candidatus Micrarchaeota archaeon]|nr:excinuclease ABC subunit UvrB [Candidatus Micrarchaeota archaeon]